MIGSGPAGSVTAGLLAENGRDVLIIEEGPGPEAGPIEPFSLEDLSLRYRNRGLNPALGAPKTAFVEACCLGGGSEINSGLYHRTPPEILDAWQTGFGLQSASYPDMLPYFEEMEDSISVCYSPGPPPIPSRKLQQGAEALGWNVCEVPRWVEYDRDECNPDGSPVAKRNTMTATWLPRAQRAGARILTGTRAHRLSRSNGSWNVSVRNRAGTDSIVARHVFLCGGAVQTPLLLRRSGIRHNVGNSLALHPTVKLLALFDDAVNYPDMGVPFHQVKEFSPALTMGCSISSPPYLAMSMSDHPTELKRVLAEWTRAAVYYVSANAPAVGTVRAFPWTGDAFIRLDPGEQALRTLACGLKNLCRLLLAAGAVELFPSIREWGSISTLEDVEKIPEILPRKHTLLSTIHLFSSCPMGEDSSRCAADSWGRVFDAPGLSIHDASILCEAPSVNPQGTIMAFACRNTLHYLEDPAR